MTPSEVATISSLRLSPSTSASSGEEAPSVRSSSGERASMSWSRWRKSCRRSLPLIGVPLAVSTTTLTVKAYGIVFGRPFESCAVPPFSLPFHDAGLPGGKSALTVAVSTCASVPWNDPECVLLPSHQLDGTCLKSALLFGWPPGATDTWHLYELRAPTAPVTVKLGAAGSICWNQSGPVISASGGIVAAPAASTPLYALRRP